MFRFFTLMLLCLPYFVGAQISDYKSVNYTLSKEKTWSPREVDDKWKTELVNTRSPFEGNSTYRQHLEGLKKQVVKRYPWKNAEDVPFEKEMYKDVALIPDTPSVGMSFKGNTYSNSAPNDNTMAINNDGILISAINTNIMWYDTKGDSVLKEVGLSIFSDTLTQVSKHQYDPKIIYDYKEDRFVLVYLAGSSSDSQKRTNIIVAFSQSSNPLGDWSFYAIPGNPLAGDTSWTDYPAISLSNDELFITGNLLRYGGTWQESFKQSVIWQIDKYDGYNGDSLDTRLYYDIKEGGGFIRNLHPVRGGNEFYGPEMYFLSNRNFSIQSDTFYLLKTSGLIADNPTLDVQLIRSDKNYGAPPNARMKGSGNRFLATNDARVLGAFYQNDHIQFVGNSIDTTFGGACFYHCYINDLNNPSVEAVLVSDLMLPDTVFQGDTLEFGYPNISYCGQTPTSKQSIISFNYSSKNEYPGFAAISSDNNFAYSGMVVLKEGTYYIAVIGGMTQRWGDYSGTQPMYNEPGKVWVSGTYGWRKSSWDRIYGTWISELTSNIEDPTPKPPAGEIETSVYPNPVGDDRVNFAFNLPDDDQVKIEVFDVQGKSLGVLWDAPAKAGENIVYFSTQSLESGVYFIRIYTASDLLDTRKFTVVKGKS